MTMALLCFIRLRLKTKNPQVIKLLLKKGANISARDIEGGAPLHWAAGFNPHPIIAKTLIANGADVNALNKYGDSPLLWGAAHSKTPKVLKEIIFFKKV